MPVIKINIRHFLVGVFSLSLCFSTYAQDNDLAQEKLLAHDNSASSSNTQSEIVEQLPVEPVNNFFYIGAKLGYNHYQHGCEAWSTDCDSNELGYGLFTGYQFNENFAFEAAYLDFGKTKAKYPENNATHEYTGSMKGVELSGVGILPLTNDFSVFGKIGAFNWYGKNKGPFNTRKSDGWSAIAGLGLTYQLNTSWQARVEYQYVPDIGDGTIGGTNAHFTSIGISYQFGRTKAKVINRTVTKVVVEKAPIILEEISFALLFDFDGTDILQPETLQMVINRLTLYPQATVTLRGYSDTKGSENYNLELSKRRVNNVSQYLISQGVNEDQITSEFFGESAPVIDNNIADHRHLNRHVKILLPQTIISPAQEEK